MRTALTLLLVLTAASAWSGAPSRAEHQSVAVIVHPSAPVSSLSQDELVAIFTMSQRRWTDGSPISAFNLNPGASVRVYFDRAVLGMDPDQAARFWIDRRIRDGGASPHKVPTAAMMLKVIASLQHSIGYVPETMVGPGVRVVARVVNGRVNPEPKGQQR